nr:MAG TPA: hypothetical protein [Caudoviricetes sp.]
MFNIRNSFLNEFSFIMIVSDIYNRDTFFLSCLVNVQHTQLLSKRIFVYYILKLSSFP